jgi:hypothetical protein
LKTAGAKPEAVMKTHPILVCLVLGVIIALGIVACTITQKHGPGVYIHETYIEIYPGTKISSDDQKALNAVLKHFDKSLYKIKTYDRGKLVKTQGGLEDALIDQKLVAEVIKASQQGISGLADQLGSVTYTSKNPVPVPSAAAPPPPSKGLRNSERLVNAVRPILQKYSNDQVANVVKSGGR